MNTSISTDDRIKFLRIYIIYRYIYLIVFSIGIIGFIAYSINNFMNLTIGLFLWSLTLGFELDLEHKSALYCKINRYARVR